MLRVGNGIQRTFQDLPFLVLFMRGEICISERMSVRYLEHNEPRYGPQLYSASSCDMVEDLTLSFFEGSMSMNVERWNFMERHWLTSL